MKSPSSSQLPQFSQSPAALSIYQLARLHCRERLLIDPLYWTARHVELLPCSFEELSRAISTTEIDFTDGKTCIGCIRKFVTRTSCFWREFDITAILASPECPLMDGGDLSFYFNRRRIRTLRGNTLSLRSERGEAPKGPLPVAAVYIDRERIVDLRVRGLSSSQSRRQSKPTTPLFALKLKKVTPPEPLHDPYIVALLIAIAQDQQLALKLSGPVKQAEASPFLSHVLLTDPNDKKNIHLFSADISLSFLQKLDFPSRPPSGAEPPSVSIRHTRVPLKPYKTFRKRIFPFLIPTAEAKVLNQTESTHLAPVCKRYGEGEQETASCAESIFPQSTLNIERRHADSVIS